MTRPSPSLIALAVITLCASSPALANDAVFGGEGAALAPLKETELKMVSEDILIERIAPKKNTANSYWKIKATYVFENPTDSKKTVTMGFPEAVCDEGAECNSSDGKGRFTFRNMKTQVDGKRVKVHVAKVGEKSGWSKSLGRVHLFDVTIPAKKRVVVKHDYGMGTSGSSMQDEWLLYITKTGALWNGPIGKARFTVRLPQRPWGFKYPKSYNLASYKTVKDGSSYATDIVFEMENWTPTDDLDMVFGSPYLSYYDCPSITTTVGDDLYVTDPNSAALKELRALSLGQLRVCRNLPYARHGYVFKDKKLNALFYPADGPSFPQSQVTSKQWPYVNYVGSREAEMRVVAFAPNEAYSPKMLTKSEKHWVKAIKAIEKERKQKK